MTRIPLHRLQLDSVLNKDTLGVARRERRHKQLKTLEMAGIRC